MSNTEQIVKSIRYGAKVFLFSPDVTRQIMAMSLQEQIALATEVEKITQETRCSILDAVYQVIQNKSGQS